MKEKDVLNRVIDEIGDISGWTILDMGSGPCTMVVCLVNRIGNGKGLRSRSILGSDGNAKEGSLRRPTSKDGCS